METLTKGMQVILQIKLFLETFTVKVSAPAYELYFFLEKKETLKEMNSYLFGKHIFS